MTLRERRNLIIASLVIKGVALYATLFMSVLFVICIDSMSTSMMFLGGISLLFLIWTLVRSISTNDFERIFFLSRKERIEFDSETV